MKLSKTTWWLIGGAGVSVFAIAGYFLMTKKLNAMNQTQTNGALVSGKQINLSGAANTREVPNWNSTFDMGYTKQVKEWLAPKAIEELDTTSAMKYAKKIKSAKGTFNDDEKMVIQIFSKHLKDKTQVSNVSKAFWSVYKQDMWQYLSSFLTPEEISQYVNRYVLQLPNYTLKK